MHPLLILPALVQPAPAAVPPPPACTLPAELQVKEGSAAFVPFDQVAFELPGGRGRSVVEGPAWRFALEAAEGRRGPSTLLQWLKPALEAAGWTWVWEQRGVARLEGKGPEAWLRVSPGGSGELAVVLVQRGEPRRLELTSPGPQVAPPPSPDRDFSFLPPWPGAVLMRCVDSPVPVGVVFPDGRQAIQIVNFIEKQYALAAPPSAHEFTFAYRRALEAAGWEIEGNFKGALIQIQALYRKDGRDLRATLRLAEDAMSVAVADVGAQLAGR